MFGFITSFFFALFNYEDKCFDLAFLLVQLFNSSFNFFTSSSFLHFIHFYILLPLLCPPTFISFSHFYILHPLFSFVPLVYPSSTILMCFWLICISSQCYAFSIFDFIHSVYIFMATRTKSFHQITHIVVLSMLCKLYSFCELTSH